MIQVNFVKKRKKKNVYMLLLGLYLPISKPAFWEVLTFLTLVSVQASFSSHALKKKVNKFITSQNEVLM